MAKRIRTHPGEVLREEFSAPLGMSVRALADAIGVPSNRISDIAREAARRIRRCGSASFSASRRSSGSTYS